MRELFPRSEWRNTLDAQHGTAATGKAALGLVRDSDRTDLYETDGNDQKSKAVLANLSPEQRSQKILSLILQELEDDKAENVVTIDLVGKTDIADAMVVASGRSQRHVGAMADKVVSCLKAAGLANPKVEGASACDWVLIDAEDVIVHLFRPEVREFYNLERVWSEAAHIAAKANA
ncbi:ribosome silencing factor [Hyphococcus formosus]|uniref:ribosome silencing factor n=1 Tax=Hyphococcus formosus TaxID=3143534 RepID=UPI00398B26FC